MRDFDQDLQKVFEHQNFIASLCDGTECPIDMQAIGRVLLLTARKIDAMSAVPCKQCPCSRVHGHHHAAAV